jgi:hypothetical protein
MNDQRDARLAELLAYMPVSDRLTALIGSLIEHNPGGTAVVRAALSVVALMAQRLGPEGRTEIAGEMADGARILAADTRGLDEQGEAISLH